jgi:hypothetical protein
MQTLEVKVSRDIIGKESKRKIQKGASEKEEPREDFVELNTMESKLTHNRIRWCRHVLGRREARTPKKD